MIGAFHIFGKLVVSRAHPPASAMGAVYPGRLVISLIVRRLAIAEDAEEWA